MKKNKIINIFKKIIIILIIIISATSCSSSNKNNNIQYVSNETLNNENEMNIKIKEILNEYLKNLKDKNVEKAIEYIYIENTNDKDYKEKIEDALSFFDYKNFNINEITKINKNIYLLKSTLNTDNNNKDTNLFVDEEFNPYLCIINNNLFIVYLKEHIPSNLYENIEEIPDNYKIK